MYFYRKTNNDTYEKTTWTIKFNLDNVNESEAYILRLALASAHQSNLQVYMFIRKYVQYRKIDHV